jgi:phospholipid/cholesterol/gamma-HCH transport system substrate-binding protein
MKRELLVGLVFAVLLGLLVGTTIWVKNPGFFKGKAAFQMTARFHEVAGLKEGDEVWIYGTKAGAVSGIKPDGKGGVEVKLDVDYDPDMRADAVVKIGQRSALGGAIVSIHPGTPDQPKMTKDIYDGKSVGDPFAEISNAVAELKEPLKDTVNQAKKVFADFAKHSDEIATNLDKTLDNARAVTDDMRAGKGTIGKLLSDDSVYNDLKDAVAGLKKLTADANGGGGTIDVLLHDKDIASDLKKTMSNIRSVSDDMEAGRGTVGKLFKDDTLYNRIDSAVKSFGDLATDARNGKGVLNKLIYDEALAKRLDTITEDVADITGKLRRGDGTLGKLINDDSLYVDLKAAIKKLGGGVDDVRENAPVLTFAGFLFKGF